MDKKGPADASGRTIATRSEHASSSKHESSLFRESIGTVKPIQTNRADFAPTQRPKPIPRRRLEIATEIESLDSPFERSFEAGDILSFAHDGVPSRQLRQLRRGRIRVESEIDLHGLPPNKAHDALELFLSDAATQGRKCVKVIHGKGLSSPEGRSVIKAKVDHWLRHDRRVLAYCSAPQSGGGTGAVTVLLRS